MAYFGGLLIGAFHGPETLYSLWQTFSDAVVFAFAFIAFGWLVDDLNAVVNRLLVVLSLWTAVLLTGSFIIYVGNLAGWWSINLFFYRVLLLNGPFNHANHMAYVLMTGAFAAGTIALNSQSTAKRLWLSLSVVLTIGIVLTFGSGAMLGTAVGLTGILAIRHRRLALTLTGLITVVAIFFVAAAAFHIPLPKFVPKITYTHRLEGWSIAIENLKEYGPLGVGARQAEIEPGLSVHNFWLEQYGEGGILTVLGALGWLILPIVHIKRFRLNRDLAWCIVAMMSGLMVHGIFWGQFLIGLRFLTLAYVCLWTALGTLRLDSDQADSKP